jgi:hypothetical protein
MNPDPDAGGPKTYGSGFGARPATLGATIEAEWEARRATERDEHSEPQRCLDVVYKFMTEKSGAEMRNVQTSGNTG